MLRPPNGGTRLELSSFVRPDHDPGSPAAMVNELGLRNVAFEVDHLQAAIDRLAADGYGLVGPTLTTSNRAPSFGIPTAPARLSDPRCDGPRPAIRRIRQPPRLQGQAMRRSRVMVSPFSSSRSAMISAKWTRCGAAR